VLFWWWSVHLLLFGRLGWRQLFPTGLVTAICLTGLSVFSALLFSSSIVSDENSYGPVGVMMVLLSYCIGLGVVIHIGAVFGRMWDERHTPVQEAA
jgi:membrane protein